MEWQQEKNIYTNIVDDDMIDRMFFYTFRSNDSCTKKYKLFCKKCLTSHCGSGIVNKLSQGIASEMLKNK